MMKNTDSQERYRIGQRVAAVCIWGNIALTLFKAAAGFIAGSTAMVADAIHSASDILATAIVAFSFRVSRLPADLEHPYGHEKAESIAAKLLATILFIAGAGIGWTGIQSIWKGSSHIPGTIALYAAITSIIIKEAMYWYTILAAKKINSTALSADAWHHRSDAFSSVGTLIGIGGARLGFPILDPIAGIIVSFFVLKIAFDIFKKSIKELMDTAADPREVEKIAKTILENKGVQGIDSLKTRMHASRIYVDLEITVDQTLSLIQAHDIAAEIRNHVKERHHKVKDILVHVNPCGHEIETACTSCSHPCEQIKS